jgi:hypothetical protein
MCGCTFLIFERLSKRLDICIHVYMYDVLVQARVRSYKYWRTHACVCICHGVLKYVQSTANQVSEYIMSAQVYESYVIETSLFSTGKNHVHTVKKTKS